MVVQTLVLAMIDARAKGLERCAVAAKLVGDDDAWPAEPLEEFAENTNIADPLALPLLESDFSGLPPTIIHFAELDPLASEGELLAQRMIGAGVQVQFRNSLGLFHGFIRFRDESDPSRFEFSKSVDGLRMFLE